MANHDLYARRTPYELLLPDEARAAELFEAIEREAEERRSGPTDPAGFLMLGAVRQAVQELRGPDEPPDRLQQHAMLLWHAFQFWNAGRSVYLASVSAVRAAISLSGEARRPLRLPTSAGYLQLPQHLVWAKIEGDQPESIDGMFWSTDDLSLTVLAATGLRQGRPGFTVIDLPRVPLADGASWLTQPVREEGDDFASSLPGADLDRLYEVRQPGELLKLLVLLLALPKVGQCAPVAPSISVDDGSGPTPSNLDFVRVDAGDPPQA